MKLLEQYHLRRLRTSVIEHDELPYRKQSRQSKKLSRLSKTSMCIKHTRWHTETKMTRNPLSTEAHFKMKVNQQKFYFFHHFLTFFINIFFIQKLYFSHKFQHFYQLLYILLTFWTSLPSTWIFSEGSSFCVFASNDIIQAVLANVEVSRRKIYVDGTFKICPHGVFKQVLVVFFELMGSVSECLVKLKRNKHSSGSYSFFFISGCSFRLGNDGRKRWSFIHRCVQLFERACGSAWMWIVYVGLWTSTKKRIAISNSKRKVQLLLVPFHTSV